MAKINHFLIESHANGIFGAIITEIIVLMAINTVRFLKADTLFNIRQILKYGEVHIRSGFPPHQK